MNERYRQIAGRDPQNKPHPDAFWTNKYGWMEHDTTLQDIADAWNRLTPGERAQLAMVHPRFVEAVANAVGAGERQ